MCQIWSASSSSYCYTKDYVGYLIMSVEKSSNLHILKHSGQKIGLKKGLKTNAVVYKFPISYKMLAYTRTESH